MSGDMRARVWAAWVEANPYDADLTPEQQDMVLDTMAGQMLALNIAASDITGPAGIALRAQIDQHQARYRDLRDKSLARLLRQFR